MERAGGGAAGWRVRSALPGVTWPALPAPADAAVLALLLQLDASQWLPPERLREAQDAQLEALLEHARETVPRYRGERLASLRETPILSRRELLERFEALKSERLPRGHGAAKETRTSGSTGRPVRLLKTDLTALLWRALTLRDHAWHGRDLSRKLAVVRQGMREGTGRDWGTATHGLLATGPCVARSPASSVEAILEWLLAEQPAYLLTYPSLLRELARACLARGVHLQGLAEVRAFGELLDPDTRALCREAFGVPLTDLYSAQEAGYIALQCPRSEHYHVQAESLIVEVLDDSGRACAPGEIGRVVVTDLHNFAMPLLRYDLGDFAEVGEPCACGRGLPVLKRIVGRVRNTLVTASGERYWPSFGVRGFPDIAPVLQHQFVQKSYDLIEARLVVARPLDSEQERRLAERIVARLPAGFRVQFAYCERIGRGAGGKYEDFVSEVSA